MLDSVSIEEYLIGLIVFLTAIGILQILYYPFVKHHIEKQIFPNKSYSVSIIVPLKGTTPTLEGNFRSLIGQKYPNYEVIFVSEREDDPGVAVARGTINEFETQGSGTLPSKVSYVCAGELEDLRMIAKSHNLIQAIEHATGDVLLFTDSDVYHPENWVQEMVNPLGEHYRGRDIHATTAVFFIDPEGFLGIFPSLSTNAAAYLASYTRRYQDFPSYASGASMAVLTSIFHKAGIVDAWKQSLNDDLVLAGALVDKGYNLFSVRRLPTRPVESFDTWRNMNNKMVRWMLTVNHYSHPNNNRDALVNGLFNLQFQTMLNLSIIFMILQGMSILTIDWLVIGQLLGITYVYNIFSRFIIARRIQERNVYPYLWLAPISQYFWGWYLFSTTFFFDSFTWGGRIYHLEKRFGRLVRKS